MRVVDLTHELADGMPVMAGLAQPRFHDFAVVERDGYAMSEYTLYNHVGTHVDAPAHQVAGGATLDEIPLDRLVTDAVTLDLRGTEPGPVSFEALEPQLGDVREGDVLLLNSGNARNWGSEAYWNGWCYPDAGAARALVERGISAIGFDGPSADPVDTTTFELHRIWLGAGRLIIENVANLDALPPRCRIVIAPMKVRRANGAPARVLAFVPDEAAR